jgi:hypothetical protein
VLGQKASVVSRIIDDSIVPSVDRHPPEADRCAVTQNEALAIKGQSVKAALTSDFLVETAPVEQGVGAKRIAFG